MKILVGFFFLWTVSIYECNSQAVKIMCWNLLNYPDQNGVAADTTLRHPYYRTVIRDVNPDILVTEENTSSAATTWFLDEVMNVNAITYSKGAFISGFDTNNEIYYRDSVFAFVSNTRIRTDVRDINEFKLVHLPTGDTLRIYAVHLKSSAGSLNEAKRAREIDSLRKITNRLPAGTNFIVCGDFNIYGDYESAYQKLLQDNVTDDGNFIDPILMTGTWHNSAYRQYHTQSTRLNRFGGGASGGLNDRFDMILFSSAINLGSSGISYAAGSATAVGNDSNHYDLSINAAPNTAVSTGVADALYNASDHLPVFAIFNFSDASGIFSPRQSQADFEVFPNPFHNPAMIKLKIEYPCQVSLTLIDLSGRELFELIRESKIPGEYELPLQLPFNLEKGIYFIHLLIDKQSRIIRIIAL